MLLEKILPLCILKCTEQALTVLSVVQGYYEAAGSYNVTLDDDDTTEDDEKQIVHHDQTSKGRVQAKEEEGKGGTANGKSGGDHGGGHGGEVCPFCCLFFCCPSPVSFVPLSVCFSLYVHFVCLSVLCMCLFCLYVCMSV